LIKLDQVPNGDGRRKVNEEVSRLVSSVKSSLSGDGDAEASADVVAQVATEVYSQDLLGIFVVKVGQMEFEARKDTCTIFSSLLRRQIGSRAPTVEYISSRPDIVFNTLKGYSNAEAALNTGMILKNMLQYEPVAKLLLYSEQFYTFPTYIENTTFGISCDAFSAMKECLTRHKPMVAQYLEANFDRFFTMYFSLITSSNYVTKRQSLKLLGEILLDRANYSVMTRYIASEDNLKLMMNFLRDKSRNIQFEAFHVFKVFVANPSKPPQIASILRRNRDRLVQFLRDFHQDKDDEQFNDEKQFLIVQIQAL